VRVRCCFVTPDCIFLFAPTPLFFAFAFLSFSFFIGCISLIIPRSVPVCVCVCFLFCRPRQCRRSQPAWIHFFLPFSGTRGSSTRGDVYTIFSVLFHFFFLTIFVTDTIHFCFFFLLLLLFFFGLLVLHGGICRWPSFVFALLVS
jgi:hypothetical protein